MKVEVDESLAGLYVEAVEEPKEGDEAVVHDPHRLGLRPGWYRYQVEKVLPDEKAVILYVPPRYRSEPPSPEEKRRIREKLARVRDLFYREFGFPLEEALPSTEMPDDTLESNIEFKFRKFVVEEPGYTVKVKMKDVDRFERIRVKEA